jgi:hypothetical protein
MERSWASRGIGVDAFAALAHALPPSELWSLLLAVFERRAAARTPATLTEQWERDGFVRPALVDQRTFVDLDGHLLAAASGFTALELSPLAPLGASSVVSPTSQNKIVSASRGTEVVSDPTNVLALECARRLKHDPGAVVRLATCHRCVRAQPYPRLPGFAPHFRIFCLASAGRERPDRAFLASELARHITTMLAALDRLEAHGYAFGPRAVTLLATDAGAAVADRIAAALPISVMRGALRHPYYDGGLRYQIGVTGPDGTAFPLIDGGAFEWVAALASNARLVYLASGMGAQLAAMVFKVR